DAMREVLSRQVPKAPTLRGRTLVTLFYEASTRTRASFEWAAKALSADVVNVTAQASSVTKGESLVDTVRTLTALGADAVVLRHPESGAAHLAACSTAVPVINGGDGWHAHPTQALLDLYTLRQRWREVAGRCVVIVGDIMHSRVARSNAWGLTALGASVVLCGPPTLLPAGLVEAFARAGRQVMVTERVEEALTGADAVMALRLQRERQVQGLLPSLRAYAQRYQINAERMALAKPGSLLLHPGPVNEGIEVSPELAAGGQSVIQEQVRNGVAVRMALLYLMMTRAEEA
ncbi:MAG: aspartate carbamoyltransferase catalytic subunit, partial [Chloroflexi bacterium]|nr:aspartate carbamoyltransferase catalytic subunit [Chloroflexota bacterium]